MPDDKDFAGICVLCKEEAFYKQGIQMTDSGRVVHDACADNENRSLDNNEV
jgi:hypothetical protein